jgi:polygalacturonase
MYLPPRPLRVLTVALALGTSLAMTASAAAPGESDAAGWSMAEEIVRQIQVPVIPRRDYLVTDFGAVGDGKSDARPAILAAIDKAAGEGGGRVVLPAGVWLSKGPVTLKSRIELHIADGATLLFSPDPRDYLPAVKTRWEGTEVMGYSPLIYARDVEDVAVTGKGILDGNAQSIFHGWKQKEKADQLSLRHMGIDGVPVERRVLAEGHFLRPSMVQFFGAKRVLLEGYTIKNSPFWVNHLVYTDHAVVRGLHVESRMANNDGVDVESSTNVLVEGNVFRTGDDSVVVKSGRDRDGREIGRPSERIVVRNNDMGGEDGIALGSEMSGGIRYVFFTDNVLRKGASAIRFKGNLDRGGVVEHIRVRNMTIESFETLVWFQLNYPGELGGKFPPVYRDIVFENLQVDNVGTALDFHGPEAAPLADVLLKDVTIKSAKTPMILENVAELRFDNLVIGNQRIDGILDWKPQAQQWAAGS